MYRQLAQLLGNISVNRKLCLGFGLVLVLTLLIAGTGWNGLVSVIDRGDKLANISKIISLTKDLRIARLEYERQPGESALAGVTNQLSELDNALALSRKQLTSPDDLALVEQQLNAVAEYKRAFADLIQGTQASDQAVERMHQQGNVLIEQSQKLSTLQATKRNNESRQATNLLIGCTLLALVLGIIAAWVITRQIVIPLQRTLITVERIAAGDLTHDHPTDRRDELGQLQQAIQRMTAGLRELIGGISDGITQIASAAEELSAVTEQTSAGVNNQKVETDQVATAMHEMAATVQEVARNAEEASEAALAADQQAREGDTVVAQALAQIEKLAIEVGHSTDAMGHLKRESDKIGSVLDVIKSVAQQTNLLALNAAIEAARAGEAGRGFAVVADEVRSLAQRTQKSTEEIEELIAGLQSGTQQVSSSMDSSRALTDNSVELTRRAGESLGNITRTVSTIQGMNQQIAAAAEQQSAVAEEINRSVLNVRDVSEQTAAASEETAASSVELARLGTHLQTLVGRFKV
ncbi:MULTISPECIES: methyl-accepting chemotaxis protein [Pseudomonas]|uniref:methyl-accepting chemotaxis protein n=1 Tax=Pseudomonas TaxID=286 RepID=UPI000E807A84|nr:MULTISPECIES: methyl-accepting chemotaxis protein [Pseudomonas]HBP48249.1 methyl-accepting chemotaxis protein [Pseudomonas sp.]